MASEFVGKVLIGVIGGSGLYHINNLTVIKKVEISTPWGAPSSAITIAALSTGTLIAFLTRHGHAHNLQPSRVPFRANIAALKSLGVRCVLAFSAVGSLREEIAPGSFVIPSQLIDRTKGVRPASFFEDMSIVAHAAFGDPFSVRLCAWLEGPIRNVLEEEGKGNLLFTNKCVVCMEGPQFSTRAESNMYRSWGGDLINMSVLPEAKLAREAEISYALIATATDYDSWRPQSDAVTTHDVLATLSANATTCRLVAASILHELHTAVEQGLLDDEKGTMQYGIMPRSSEWKKEDERKLAFVLPDYFSIE